MDGARQSAGDVRGRLLAAGAEVFVAQGFRDARLAQIAKLAGVSRSTLYEHFPGKEQLLLALNHQLIDALLAQMRATLGTAPTAREGIRDWLLTGIRPGERHRMLLKIIYADAVQPSLLLDRAATAQSIRDAQVWVREALARGIAAGEFRADMDVARTAHSLQNIHSLLTRQAVADYPLFEVGAHEEASILELLMRGLGTRD